MAEYVKVAQIGNIPTGEATIVEVEGEEICIAKRGRKNLRYRQHMQPSRPGH